MERERGPRVLLFGSARSGTTWTARVLGAAPGARLLSEPDRPYSGPHSVKAMWGIGGALVLRPGDRPPRRVERLWSAVLGSRPVRRVPGRNRLAYRLYAGVTPEARRRALVPGATRPGGRLGLAASLSQPPRFDPQAPLVVKTVSSVFAVEWLLHRWRPAAVWIRRHPLEVLASRLALDVPLQAVEGLDDRLTRSGHRPSWCPPLPPAGEVAARTAWHVGAVMSWCRDLAAADPGIVVVDHEDLCADPVDRFRELAVRVGLEWDRAAEEHLGTLDAPGEGWEVRRITAAEPGKWRRALPPDQWRELAGHLAPFPIADDYEDLAACRS